MRPTSRVRPEGLTYRANFIDAVEEQALIEKINMLTFNEVRMHGVVARRMTLHFGWSYDYEGWKIEPVEPPPPWLEPLIRRSAEAAQIERAAIEQVMVARYPEAAAIGWHRDAPMFGSPVIGVSLLSACTMKFRRLVSRKTETLRAKYETYGLLLEPRSLYIIDGEARSRWQHSIPRTDALRSSVTMRTLKKPPQMEGGEGDSRDSKK